jgi:hypothetical protein
MDGSHYPPGEWTSIQAEPEAEKNEDGERERGGKIN